jgi:hypothetical protein
MVQILLDEFVDQGKRLEGSHNGGKLVPETTVGCRMVKLLLVVVIVVIIVLWTSATAVAAAAAANDITIRKV